MEIQGNFMRLAGVQQKALQVFREVWGYHTVYHLCIFRAVSYQIRYHAASAECAPMRRASRALRKADLGFTNVISNCLRPHQHSRHSTLFTSRALGLLDYAIVESVLMKFHVHLTSHHGTSIVPVLRRNITDHCASRSNTSKRIPSPQLTPPTSSR